MVFDYSFLQKNERVCMEGFAARYYLHMERRGRLVLTNSRMLFLFKSLLGTRTLELPFEKINEIKYVDGNWSRENMIIVSAGEKKAYKFFIDSNFDTWQMNINQAMHIKK